MKTRMPLFSVTCVAVGLLLANTSSAFDMGNVMNPSKWMGGNSSRDRYDDYGGYGYPGGPGYGYPGGPGYGDGGAGYAPYYRGAPGYGYGAPAYGGAPGYDAPPTNVNATEEVERLRERVRMLEEAARQQQAAPVAAPAPNPVWRGLQPNYSTPAGSHVGGYR